MGISMRVSEKEKKLIQDVANVNGMSTSEYIRKIVLERIEDEYDLKCYEEAMKEYKADPVTYTHEEIGKMLGLL